MQRTQNTSGGRSTNPVARCLLLGWSPQAFPVAAPVLSLISRSPLCSLIRLCPPHQHITFHICTPLHGIIALQMTERGAVFVCEHVETQPSPGAGFALAGGRAGERRNRLAVPSHRGTGEPPACHAPHRMLEDGYEHAAAFPRLPCSL